MTYQLVMKRSAEKELLALPAADQARVEKLILSLAENPRPIGCEKLSGRMEWRVRAGNFRVLYTIDDNTVIVVIVKVGNRREVYR